MALCRQLALDGPRMRGAMGSRLSAISFDAHQSERLTHFWSGVLGLERTDDSYDGIALPSGNDADTASASVPPRRRRPPRTGCTST